MGGTPVPPAAAYAPSARALAHGRQRADAHAHRLVQPRPSAVCEEGRSAAWLQAREQRKIEKREVLRERRSDGTERAEEQQRALALAAAAAACRARARERRAARVGDSNEHEACVPAGGKDRTGEDEA